MKINFPFSILVLYPILAGLSVTTTYQSKPLEYNTYCFKNNEQKEWSRSTHINSCSRRLNKTMNNMAVIPEKISGLKQPTGILKKGKKDKIKIKESYSMAICLSHPGYKYKNSNKVSYDVLDGAFDNMDWNKGDHTHTFFDNRINSKNKKEGNDIVNQAGWPGKVSGSLNFEFTKFSGKKLVNSQTISVSQKTGG